MPVLAYFVKWQTCLLGLGKLKIAERLGRGVGTVSRVIAAAFGGPCSIVLSRMSAGLYSSADQD